MIRIVSSGFPKQGQFKRKRKKKKKRCTLDSRGMYNLKKLKCQKLTYLCICYIVETGVRLRKNTGRKKFDKSSMLCSILQPSVLHQHCPSHCLSVNCAGQPVCNHRKPGLRPRRCSSTVCHQVSFCSSSVVSLSTPTSLCYLFPDLLAFIPDNIWTCCPKNVSYQSQNNPNPTLCGTLLPLSLPIWRAGSQLQACSRVSNHNQRMLALLSIPCLQWSAAVVKAMAWVLSNKHCRADYLVGVSVLFHSS